MDKNINSNSFMNSEDSNIYALSIGDAMAGMMLILIMAFVAIFLQVKPALEQNKEIAELKEKIKLSKNSCCFSPNSSIKYFYYAI